MKWILTKVQSWEWNSLWVSTRIAFIPSAHRGWHGAGEPFAADNNKALPISSAQVVTGVPEQAEPLLLAESPFSY